MTRGCRTLVVFVVVLTAAVVGLAVPPAAADTGAEADFVERVNGARSAKGLGRLAVDGELTAIARRWSQRMANDQRLSHNPNLAKEVSQDWEKLAENVGVGSDVGQIHDAFMNSSSHRQNILDGALTHIGVGVVVDDSGQLWVTEVFMRLRGGSSAPATTAPPTTAKPTPAPTAAPSTTTTRPRAVTTTTRPAAPAPTPAPTASRPTGPAPTTVTTTAAVDATAAAPAPTTEPTPATGASPRLVLVLDGLRALDRGR